MPSTNNPRYTTTKLFTFCAILLICAASAQQTIADEFDPTDRIIASVRVSGANQIPQRMVLNQVRAKPGDTYNQKNVALDIKNITRLGRFATVTARVEQNDNGSVNLIYLVTEQPLLADIQILGNKAISDLDLMPAILLQTGDPADRFLINRGREEITKLYHKAGYFHADVTIDQDALTNSQTLIYTVREGAQIRIRQIKFEGNHDFTYKQLKSQIGSKKHIFVIRDGKLSEEQLTKDVARLRSFYEQRGYLDVRVGRHIQLSDNQEDATIVFLINEGTKYTVGTIGFTGNQLFPETQLRQAMTLKRGDVFSKNQVIKSQIALEDLYGKLGFLPPSDGGSTNITMNRVFDENKPVVHLKVNITEGHRYRVGSVNISGNVITKDNVMRREIRGMQPGQYFELTGLSLTRKRISESPLFSEAKVTVQGNKQDDTRDVLVEVKEGRTGEISIGAAVSSDSGVSGAFSITEHNFDITDFPESFDDIFSKTAFRGAGQRFSLNLQPGVEQQDYTMSFGEPNLLDQNFSFNTAVFLRKRERDNYNDGRFGGIFGFGKAFGDVYSTSIHFRQERIDINNVEVNAPNDVHRVAGNSSLDSVGIAISKNTVDSYIYPSTGSRTTLSIDQFGPLGGDYDFTRGLIKHSGFWTIKEDFFGNKTTLRLASDISYILNGNAPVFERFYAGGHSSLRGFNYRGIGPRGMIGATQGTDPVGGDFLFLLGLEYRYPIAKNVLAGVFFIDSGTVSQDVDFNEYRVSIGTGIRLTVPFLGQRPFAFDLAYPLVKENNDDTRNFSFSIDLPF